MTLPQPHHLDVHEIALDGELNALTSPALRQRVTAALESGVRSIVIDLSRVGFIDSSGLGALVAGLKGARLLGGTLALSGVTPGVRPIFELTQADRIFDIFDTLEQALVHLDGKRPL